MAGPLGAEASLLGTALDNLWYLASGAGSTPPHGTTGSPFTDGSGGGGDGASSDWGWTGLGAARAILIPLLVLDVFLFLNVLYFLKNTCKAYQSFCGNFRLAVIKRNQNPATGKSTNQVPLLSPFLRLIGLYVDMVVMLVTGAIISSLVGLCILALIALTLVFFTLVSFLQRTKGSEEVG